MFLQINSLSIPCLNCFQHFHFSFPLTKGHHEVLGQPTTVLLVIVDKNFIWPATSTQEKPYFSSAECDQDLKKHKLQQHKAKMPHGCNQCGFSSVKADKLKIHMRVHSGEKPFNCAQCEYSCTQAGQLKTHILTHSGERPFICKQCNYSSTNKAHLNRHMLIHSGKKSHTCKQCCQKCPFSSDKKWHFRRRDKKTETTF